jgi:hypothetical protein
VPGAGGGGGFYFYNPQMVSQGKTQFQRKWGRRTLEDDWRRRNKKVTTFEESGTEETGPPGNVEEQLAADSLALPDSISDNPKTREYYLQQIPSTEEEIEASNLIIIDGMYHIGLIYKDKLDDMPLSIEALEALENRFPENEYLLECYFQIYLMALRAKDAELAERYKAKMIAAFPKEDYTIAISDPDYEQNIRSMDSVQAAIYGTAYAAYLAEDTALVHQSFYDVGAKYPLAPLLPKFMFLHALAYVQQGDAEAFKEALKALVEKYPKADVTELAGEMLKGVLRGREMVQGGFKGMIWNMRFGDDGTLSAEDSARTFAAEKNQPCRVILMYPDGRINRNELLYVAALYNFSNFIVKELDMAFEDAGPVRMLTISGFINFDEALQYYKMIYGEGGYASNLSREIAVIPITDDNYTTLMRGKTLDEYIDFLEENYAGEVAPLVARLRARLDAAALEEETPQPEVQPGGEEPAQTFPENKPAEEAAQEGVAEEIKAVETQTEAPAVTPLSQDTIPTQTVAGPEAAPDSTTLPPSQAPVEKVSAPKMEKPKTPAQLRKEKEQAYKARLKQKQKEQKEKERAYKQKLKEREKARREALKGKK